MRHDGVANGHGAGAGATGGIWPGPGGRPLDRVRAKLDEIFHELGLDHRRWPAFKAREAPGEATGPEPVLEDAWDPDVAIYRKGDTVVVRAELAGVEKDHVHVDVGSDALLISGETEPVDAAGELDHHRSERNHGRFFRKIPLVEGADAEHCEAHFRDGVLEVEFQLPHDPKPKRTHIEIT